MFPIIYSRFFLLTMRVPFDVNYCHVLFQLSDHMSRDVYLKEDQ